jgi:hypothetical protein
MAKRIVTRSLSVPRSKPFHDGIPFPPWPEPDDLGSGVRMAVMQNAFPDIR